MLVLQAKTYLPKYNMLYHAILLLYNGIPYSERLGEDTKKGKNRERQRERKVKKREGEKERGRKT